MLTKKQQWRRQVKCIKRPISDGVYEMGITRECDAEGVRRCQSDTQTALSTSLIDLSKIKKFLSDFDIFNDDEHEDNKKQKKSVSFGKPIRVILIPTREEYVNAKLDEYIWWNRLDYDEFKSSAIGELNSVMRDWSLNRNKAKIFLYQPLNKEFKTIRK